MMEILEDTRQQEHKHENKHKYFREHGIRWRRVTLPCGDYQLPGDGSVTIDTKKDIEEFIGDVQIKQMPKGEIKKEILLICEANERDFETAMTVFTLIVGDDTGRYPEGEISQYCFYNRIEGNIYKCRIMRKTGNANKEVCHFYLNHRPGDDEKAMLLRQYGFARNDCSMTVSATTEEKEFQKLHVKRYGFLHRDLKRAVHDKIRFIFLIETPRTINSIDDVETNYVNKRQWKYEQSVRKAWNIPYGVDFEVAVNDLKAQGASIKPGPQNGKKVAKIMRTMVDKYGVEFYFCRKNETGKRIVELLTGQEGAGL